MFNKHDSICSIKFEELQRQIQKLRGDIIDLKNEKVLEHLKIRIEKLGLDLSKSGKYSVGVGKSSYETYSITKNNEPLFTFTWYLYRENSLAELNAFLEGVSTCSKIQKRKGAK